MEGFLFKLKQMGVYAAGASEKVALIRDPQPETWYKEITTFHKGDIAGLKQALDLFILNNPKVFAVDGSLRPVRTRKTLTFEYDENEGLQLNLPPGATILCREDAAW